MTPKAYIEKESEDRQKLLSSIHSIIEEKDKTVIARVEPMMGKEMIVYKGKGLMKYALSSTKNYMTIHVLPIYGSKILYDKYFELLSKASFQKGCINFKTAEEMPLNIVKQLITDCAKIDLFKIRQEYLDSKKKKNKV